MSWGGGAGGGKWEEKENPRRDWWLPWWEVRKPPLDPGRAAGRW